MSCGVSKLQSHASCDEDAKMPLLPADSFTYQFYRSENPQNDRSPYVDTARVLVRGVNYSFVSMDLKFCVPGIIVLRGVLRGGGWIQTLRGGVDLS